MVRSDARGRLDLAEMRAERESACARPAGGRVTSGDRAKRRPDLSYGAFSVYYTTPDGRYRSRAYGTGTAGHAHYLMTEGQAYEQARELADLMNVSRVEIVQVRGSRHARAHIRRPPRRR